MLHSILSPEELGAIPEASIKKIESACEKKFEDFLTAKALCETTKTDLGKWEMSLPFHNVFFYVHASAWHHCNVRSFFFHTPTCVSTCQKAAIPLENKRSTLFDGANLFG